MVRCVARDYRAVRVARRRRHVLSRESRGGLQTHQGLAAMGRLRSGLNILAKIQAKEIVSDVRAVLLKAARGKDRGGLSGLSTYQILARLPRAVSARLIADHGKAGAGSGHHHSASQVIHRAIRTIEPAAEEFWVDTRGLLFETIDHSVKPGYRICALYRLTDYD